MQINKNLAISDSGFIFNPATGDSFTTNIVGQEIIKLLKEDNNKSQLKAALLNKFSIDEASLEKDIADFISILESYQLIITHEE